MNIDSYLTTFLFQQEGVLQLGGVGKLEVSEELGESKENTSRKKISFTFNPKVVFQPALVEYIASETNKTPQLVLSDLITYSQSIMSIVNIGNSHTIKGIGSFIKDTSSATIIFISDISSLQKSQAELKNSKNKPLTNMANTQTVSIVLGSIAVLVALVLIIGLLANKSEVKKTSELTTDPSKLNAAVSIRSMGTEDSTGSATPVVANKEPNAPSDSTAAQKNTRSFRFYFERSKSKETVLNRYKLLLSKNFTAEYDSILSPYFGKLYRVYILKQMSFEDTSTFKENIKDLYNLPIKMEIIP